MASSSGGQQQPTEAISPTSPTNRHDTLASSSDSPAAVPPPAKAHLLSPLRQHPVVDYSGLDAEKVLDRMGKYGKYQMLVYAMPCFAFYIFACETMVMGLIAKQPTDFTCHLTESGLRKNFTVLDRCTILTSLSGVELKQPCGTSEDSYFVYDTGGYVSLVTEFNLVCTNEYAAQHGTSLFMIGGMITTPLLIQLADRYGRRYTFLVPLWLTVACNIGCALASTYPLFLLFRFFAGLCTAGVGTVGFVIMLEAVASSFRSLTPIFSTVTWVGGYMTVGILHLFIRDWRYLYLTLMAPGVLTVVYYWVLPESLHWLITNRKTHHVSKYIRRSARINRVEVLLHECYSHLKKRDEDEEEEEGNSEGKPAANRGKLQAASKVEMERAAIQSLLVAEEETKNDKQNSSSNTTNKEAVAKEDSSLAILEEGTKMQSPRDEEGKDKVASGAAATAESSRTFIDMLKSGPMLFHLALHCYIMIVMNFTYWALSLFAVDLHAEDEMAGYFLSGLVEIPAGLVAPLLLAWFGRKTVNFLALGGQCITMLGAVLVPPGHSYASMVFPLAAKTFNSVAWASEPLLLGEMAPTSLRNVFYGSVGFVGEIGSIVAPYFKMLKSIDESAPALLICAMSLLAAFAALCSPETKNKSMPRDVEDFDAGPVYNLLFPPRITATATRVMERKRTSVDAEEENNNGGGEAQG